MRILVTGGAGFIGSAVVRDLIANGDDVFVLDNLTYAGSLTSFNQVLNHKNFKFLRADICNRAALDPVFAQFQPQGVMHLAAESHVDRSINSAGEFVQTNIVGTYTLLESARTFWTGLPATAKSEFRFLHVSTDEVYGSLGAEGLFSESTPYDPSSPYSASKAAADHLAKAWQRTYGMPVIVSNCSNNYGPFQFPEKLIPLVILNALHTEPLPVYGAGTNIRDWLYVDDHARALNLILRRGRVGETYNVGGQNERQNIEIVQSICGLLDGLLPATKPHANLIRHVVDRPGHDYRYAIDASKLESELGWRAEETFDSGIAKTVNWYLENAWWWRPLREKIYSGERLGLMKIHS